MEPGRPPLMEPLSFEPGRLVVGVPVRGVGVVPDRGVLKPDEDPFVGEMPPLLGDTGA